MIEIEDCSDDEEDKNADIDDTAAAATFLRNKKDSEAQKQKATGARQKFICHKINPRKIQSNVGSACLKSKIKVN